VFFTFFKSASRYSVLGTLCVFPSPCTTLIPPLFLLFGSSLPSRNPRSNRGETEVPKKRKPGDSAIYHTVFLSSSHCSSNTRPKNQHVFEEKMLFVPPIGGVRHITFRTPSHFEKAEGTAVHLLYQLLLK
jgi:hypothetical protein